jgi:hypothetical protein
MNLGPTPYNLWLSLAKVRHQIILYILYFDQLFRWKVCTSFWTVEVLFRSVKTDVRATPFSSEYSELPPYGFGTVRHKNEYLDHERAVHAEDKIHGVVDY